MRNWFVFLGLLGVLAMTPAAHGADLSGTWTGAFDMQGTNVPLTFELTAADSAVTGTVKGLPTSPAEIQDGKIDGDAVSFWVTTAYQDESYKVIFKGQVASGGDAIAFTMSTEDGSWSTSLTAKRSADAPGTGGTGSPAASDDSTAAAAAGTGASAAAPGDDVDGTWKGTFNYQGTDVPVTLVLKNADGAVTGTVDGMGEDGPTTLQIHDGKLQDGTLTFWVTSTYDGDEYKLVYTGKIEGNKINFNFGTDDGSFSSTLMVTKAE